MEAKPSTKKRFVKQYAAGVMIWEISQDTTGNFSLLRTIPLNQNKTDVPAEAKRFMMG